MSNQHPSKPRFPLLGHYLFLACALGVSYGLFDSLVIVATFFGNVPVRTVYEALGYTLFSILQYMAICIAMVGPTLLFEAVVGRGEHSRHRWYPLETGIVAYFFSALMGIWLLGFHARGLALLVGSAVMLSHWLRQRRLRRWRVLTAIYLAVVSALIQLAYGQPVTRDLLLPVDAGRTYQYSWFLLVPSVVALGYALVSWRRGWVGEQTAPERRLLLRSGLLLGLLAGAGIWGSWSWWRRAQSLPARRGVARYHRRPNILLVIMDTTRYDGLSINAAGHRQLTPELDRFAEQCTVYDQAISTSFWTYPSHAAMLTGLMPGQTDTDRMPMYLADHFATLPEILSRAGYRTYGVANNPYISHETNLARGFDLFSVYNYGLVYADERSPSLMREQELQRRLRRVDYGAAPTARGLCDWMRETADSERPFFAMANFMEPHLYYGMTPFRDRWLRDEDEIARARQIPQDYWAYLTDRLHLDEERFRLLRALYDSDLTYLDLRIGALLKEIERLGILDNTLIMITSDHGEEFGEHNLMGHLLCLYNSLIRVPLLVRYPGGAGRATRTDRLVQNIDLFATALEAAGVEDELSADSLARSLLASPDRQRLAFAEHGIPYEFTESLKKRWPDQDVRPFLREMKSAQNRDYKFIWASDGRHELFDLQRDPTEQVNIIRQNPKVAARMHRRMIESGVLKRA